MASEATDDVGGNMQMDTKVINVADFKSDVIWVCMVISLFSLTSSPSSSLQSVLEGVCMVISHLALLALPLHRYIMYYKEHNMGISPLALCCQAIYTHIMIFISQDIIKVLGGQQDINKKGKN